LRNLRAYWSSTAALAAAAGITTNSYARIELGQSAPSWASVRAIAAALDVSLVELGAAVEAEQGS